MCAKSLVLTNEDEKKFQAMRDGYMQHFQPEGEVELDLVEEVISARWRQRRIWGIETALLDLQMDTQMKEIEDQFNVIDETTRTAIAYKSLADTSRSLTQTTRHEALFSRQYRLAMKTLIQMQKERKVQCNSPDGASGPGTCGVTQIPETSTWALVAAGFLAFGVANRLRFRQRA
jgi:hypothetical protein